MAFATFFIATDDTFVPKGSQIKTYNFDQQVRTFAGGGNLIDVMLLQALFRMFFYEFPGRDGDAKLSTKPPPGSNGTIKVDGIVGEQTRFHIQHWQKLLAQRGVTKTTDGVMDPFPKQGGPLSPHTKQPFQLLVLNIQCLGLATREGDAGIHQNMIFQSKHPDPIYQPKLRAALATPRAMR